MMRNLQESDTGWKTKQRLHQRSSNSRSGGFKWQLKKGADQLLEEYRLFGKVERFLIRESMFYGSEDIYFIRRSDDDALKILENVANTIANRIATDI